MEELAKKVLRIIYLEVIYNAKGYSVEHRRLNIEDFNKLIEDVKFTPYLNSKLSESHFVRNEADRRRISRFEDVLFWDRAVAIENYIEENLKIRTEHDTFSCITFNAIHYSNTLSIYKDIKNLLIFKTTITEEEIENIKLYEDVTSI